LSVIGVALPIYDMTQHGINADNGTDAAAAGMAFVPGGGWIVAPLLLLTKKTQKLLDSMEAESKRRLLRDTPISSKPKDNNSGIL
jgi:hypothetical protein